MPHIYLKWSGRNRQMAIGHFRTGRAKARNEEGETKEATATKE